ncbi:hypothetical protein BX666DRAFT_2027263 [Dichotomocladium elegans]|nr:hypothetical protein BX666DRAFT_2027263 [Dichotomocladium elegans]
MSLAFRAADQMGAGLLDTDGVFEALKELKFPTINKTRISELVSVFGKEEYIDMEGFKKLVDELIKGETEEEAMRQLDYVFGALANSAGFITLESLQKASQQEGFSVQELREMLNEADTNHDGRIDRTEFVNVWRRAGMP